MYFHLNLKSKEDGKVLTNKLIVATDRHHAINQSKEYVNKFYGDDELALKRAGVTYSIDYVSPERHEEILNEFYALQDGNHEIKAAALVLSAGEIEPETRLSRIQCVEAARLVIEPSAFPKEYSRALGLTLMHLHLDCEVNDDDEEDWYEDIPEAEMTERRLSRLEPVYWGCAEHYGFPPALKRGGVWRSH